jgi:glycosyltransferase involved in cell wall biosynthesis
MERLRQRGDIDATLFVVGGEQQRAPRRHRWYDVVPLPTTDSHYAYPDFVPWLRSQRDAWTMAVAPLSDTPFNRYKSDLKHLEYAALGVPGIFSNVVPYRNAVRHEETGLLTENTTDAWCAAILRLAFDADLRERMADSARRYVLAERCLRNDAAEYVQLLRSIPEQAMTVA